MDIPNDQLGAFDRGSNPIPGELLLRPLAITSAALLVLNDHWMKYEWPGWVTGKMSDFAGLILFPLLLASLAEFLRLTRARSIVKASDAVMWPALCGIGFALVKGTFSLNEAYAWAVGSVRWPFQAIAAMLDSDALPHIQPILVARDLTDLVALMVLPVPYILIRTRFDNTLKRHV